MVRFVDFQGYARFVNDYILIYCQNCRMAKQRKTNQMTLPKLLITFLAMTFFIYESCIMIRQK